MRPFLNTPIDDAPCLIIQVVKLQMESQMDEVLKLFVERLGEPEKPGTVFPHREYKPKGNTYNREKRIQDAIERQKQVRLGKIFMMM